MKVKTKKELSELDEELNLFDESDWNFLNVQSGSNLEYFNDIRDNDFRKRGVNDVLRYFTLTLIVCSIFIILGVWLYNTTLGRYALTDGDANSVSDKVVTLQRVRDAEKADDSDLIEISKVISSYFNILQVGSSYDVLNNFCLTSSTFYSTEKAYREKMEYSYDTNDCYSRALRCFGKYFSVSKINEVLVKDDIYYTYTNMGYPDDDVLTEYFYLYANDMTKFFNVNSITEQNVVKYIIQLADTYGIPSSNEEVCIKMCKTDSGEFVIMDDSLVTNQCTTSYNYAISQVIKILGGTKAINQYD